MTRAVDIHDAVTQPAASSGVRPRIPRPAAPGTTREEAICAALAAVADVYGAQHWYCVSIDAAGFVARASVHRGDDELHRIGDLNAITYAAALRLLLDEALRLQAKVCGEMVVWP